MSVLEGGAAEGGLVLFDGKPLPGVTADVRDGRLVASAPWSGRVVDGAATELLAREDFEIIGRPGDVAGEAVLPALEAQLRDSPYFTEAALVPGDGGLVAHVGLDVDAAGVWAAANGVHAPTPRALAAEQAIQELARDEVERLAGGVAGVGRRAAAAAHAGRRGADAAAGRAPRGTAGVIGPRDEHPHPVAPQAFQTWKENWCLCAVDPAAALRGRLPRVAAARARRGDLLGQAVRGGARGQARAPAPDRAGPARVRTSRTAR